jgi:hypothetical protein
MVIILCSKDGRILANTPMNDIDPIVTLKLSIQRALLGEVAERLASVTCGIKGQVVSVRAYVSGPVREADLERLSFIAAEVIADFPEGYTIEESCLSVDESEQEMLDFWAFRTVNFEPAKPLN